MYSIVHKNGLKRMLNTSSKRLFLSEAIPNEKKQNDFNKDLGLVTTDVLRYKMQVSQFYTFLEKYTGKQIPDESALRKNNFEPIFGY